jgi:16S rRNA (adenine1518-N6/adenine1519-N6)-dimethyltransferase
MHGVAGARAMKLSDLRWILREIGVTPVKTLGQNFLHDQNLSRWIIEQANLTQGDLAVEIGPGLGALTELALARAGRVLAIEKDARLVEFLRRHFAGAPLEVQHADALALPSRASS